MESSRIRHTYTTERDVEKISSDWKVDKHIFALRDTPGIQEIRLIADVSEEQALQLSSIDSLHIISKTSEDTGDLITNDNFPGTTIKISSKNQLSSAALLQIDSLLERITGRRLVNNTGKSAFIDVETQRLYHDGESSIKEMTHFTDGLFPELLAMAGTVNLIEITYDLSQARFIVRVVSRTPNTVILDTSHATSEVEIGLVQRQQQHLKDSEVKGLSAFLPANDLEPFMIFFDQRVRPGGNNSTQIQSSIVGQGSHLRFSTDIVDLGDAEKFSPASSCKILGLYTLPKTHFFDVFEIKGLGYAVSKLYGEFDLENPIWRVDGWGSMLLTELPEKRQDSTVQMPFHARYHNPNLDGDDIVTSLHAPIMFQACHEPESAFLDNPWDGHSVLSHLVGDDYSFRIFNDIGPANFMVQNATADTISSKSVLLFTVLSITLGFIFLLHKLGCVFRQPHIVISQVRQ